MQASIEIRVPLATPKLFQNSLNTKIKYLMDFRNSKIPLLSVLNEKLNLKLFKRAKEGFNPDLDNLLTTIGEEKITELLQCEILLKYVKKDFIMNLLHEHKLGNKNNSYRIYQLLYFKFWLKHNT
jgi:asparagine synthase (glutamine-hydrolysing)